MYYNFMIVRLGLIVAASIAAYGVQQLLVRTSKSSASQSGTPKLCQSNSLYLKYCFISILNAQNYTYFIIECNNELTCRLKFNNSPIISRLFR